MNIKYVPDLNATHRSNVFIYNVNLNYFQWEFEMLYKNSYAYAERTGETKNESETIMALIE